MTPGDESITIEEYEQIIQFSTDANEVPTCGGAEDTSVEDVALTGTIDSCADTNTYAQGSTPARNGSVVFNLDGSFKVAVMSSPMQRMPSS
ncbi:MAG: hypothetical protein ACRDG7_10890, partial [Candidatus Limnocylindria bacterium]